MSSEILCVLHPPSFLGIPTGWLCFCLNCTVQIPPKAVPRKLHVLLSVVWEREGKERWHLSSTPPSKAVTFILSSPSGDRQGAVWVFLTSGRVLQTWDLPGWLLLLRGQWERWSVQAAWIFSSICGFPFLITVTLKALQALGDPEGCYFLGALSWNLLGTWWRLGQTLEEKTTSRDDLS